MQRDQDGDDERLVREEEAAAAREAGRIGGSSGDRDVDPADRPVRQAGGGEAEGFEDAERELIEHAENSSGEGAPRLDDFDEEAELSGAVYGEADREDVSETVRERDGDPDDEDPDAGSAGPADR